MPEISVIVPVYNAKAYLARCVDSIRGQTMVEFELILVNDGSVDGSGAMCDQYAAQDPRIRVIHQENHGLSHARNRGTELAAGTYITYIDSDDYVEPYYLEYLWRALKENDADCAVARVDRVREDSKLTATDVLYRTECWTQRNALSEILTGKKTTVSSWNKLAPKAWYLKHPYLEGKSYEDLSNTYKILMEAAKVAFVDAVLYHYAMSGGSITGRRHTTASQCCDYEEAISLCTETILKKYPELLSDASVLIARDYMSLYLSICRCKEQTDALLKIRSRVLTWFQANWKMAAANAKAPFEVRLRICLMRLSPYVYRKAYYWGIKLKGKNLG